MKVLVTGDRNYKDKDLVNAVLDHIHGEWGIVLLIEGCAPGADRLAEEWCKANHVDTLHYPADWNNWGKAAGPIRNKLMIEQHPDLVVAFHDRLRESRGTAHTVKLARAAHIEIMHIGRE